MKEFLKKKKNFAINFWMENSGKISKILLKKNNDKNLVRKKIDNCGKNLEKSEKKQRIFLKKVNYGR